MLWWSEKANKELVEYCATDRGADEVLLHCIKEAVLFHARNLHKEGYLTKEEVRRLKRILSGIEGNIQDEDGHTHVLEKIKERDRKLYSRIRQFMSRNEQVVIAELCYAEKALSKIKGKVEELIKTLEKKAEEGRKVRWIAMTHHRVAGAYTVKDWLLGYKRVFQQVVKDIEALKSLAKEKPWGTGAGFGTPFSEIPPAYTQLLRALLHTKAIGLTATISLFLSKLSWDLIIYSSEWSPYLTLPFAFGSSAMPHKRNPDFLEVIRAEHVVLSTNLAAVFNLHNLPTGYHRDYQKGKELMVESFERVLKKLELFIPVLRSITFNSAAVKKDIKRFHRLLVSFTMLSHQAKKGEGIEKVYRTYQHHVK